MYVVLHNLMNSALSSRAAVSAVFSWTFFHVILWFQMFHRNQSNQWHQDGKDGQPKKWEGAWEEEWLSQSSRLLSPQAINGFWMALRVSHMQKMRTLLFPTMWREIVLKFVFIYFVGTHYERSSFIQLKLVIEIVKGWFSWRLYVEMWNENAV